VRINILFEKLIALLVFTILILVKRNIEQDEASAPVLLGKTKAIHSSG
jgi:hypothetical protein